MDSYDKAKEEAQALGAVKVGRYHVHKRPKLLGRELYSSHFFNEDGLEVGLHNHSLAEINTVALTVMNPPRAWSPENMATLEMSDLRAPSSPKP